MICEVREVIILFMRMSLPDWETLTNFHERISVIVLVMIGLNLDKYRSSTYIGQPKQVPMEVIFITPRGLHINMMSLVSYLD